MSSSVRSARGATRHEVIEKGERDLVMGYLDEIGGHAELSEGELLELGRRKESGEQAEWYRIDLSALSDAERTARRETAERGRVARLRLIDANLGLVVEIARRYQGQGLGMHALIEAGNRGLVRAVDKFDGTPEHLTRSWGEVPTERTFSAFASGWIRAAIHRALDVADHPRVPRSGESENNAHARMLMDLLDDLPQRLGRGPTVDEVAAELGFTPQRARHYASTMIAQLEDDPNERDAERAALLE